MRRTISNGRTSSASAHRTNRPDGWTSQTAFDKAGVGAVAVGPAKEIPAIPMVRGGLVQSFQNLR